MSSADRKREPEPAEDVVDDRLGDRDLLVAGEAGRLEPDVGELVDEVLERHAVLERQAIVVAKVSIRPDTVEPSLAILRKISPGWPSG